MVLPSLDREPNEGTCRICEETFTYQGITRHLKNCVNESSAAHDPSEWLHVRFRSAGIATKPYWLHTLVDPVNSLERLDTYLREIWYRTGNDRSEFSLTRTIYSSHPEQTGDRKYPVESMDCRIGDMIEQGTEIRYRFELQSSRSVVRGKVYGRLPVPDLGSDEDDWRVPGLLTLARNLVVRFECMHCGDEHADYRCFDCINGVCESCEPDHSADHRLLTVRNSPLATHPR